jgi:hypothetical protein
MSDETVIRVRQTAAAYAEAVRQTQRFFDRISDTADPAVLAEYAALVEDEKRAAEDRLDAIQAAGFDVPSIDEGDPDT